MSEELKITKERVLAAADSCGTAKEVLRKLFPEVFGDKWADITKDCYIEVSGDEIFIKDKMWYYFAIGPAVTGVNEKYTDGRIKREARTCDGLPFDVKIDNSRIWRKESR